MSKADILAEIEKLSPQDRNDIRLRLAELDNEDWLEADELSDADKRLIESRLDECERQPQSFVSWEEAKAQLKSRSRS